MEPSFGYTFPAIRGVQAAREFYVSMCPLRLIPRVFSFDEEELPAEQRAQRVLNKGRIPEIANYILSNRDGYVFSALTASVDASVKFTSMTEGTAGEALGLLQIPMDARFIINDGQHRRAAIEVALRENPELGDESIAVVFFLDPGLARCQQMFADLNRYAIRPSTSIGVLYDHRDEGAQIARDVVFRSQLFRDVTEMEKTTLSKGSRKLFTLSAIYRATNVLVQGWEPMDREEAIGLVVSFWETVATQFPEWEAVRQRKMSAGEVRSDFIHSHGIALQALGRVGNQLIRKYEKSWKKRLTGLSDIDWSRRNEKLWNGRVMQAGRILKSHQGVILTGNAIKKSLKMELTPDELRVEESFKRGAN